MKSFLIRKILKCCKNKVYEVIMKFSDGKKVGIVGLVARLFERFLMK
jgi:hypothetical protein